MKIPTLVLVSREYSGLAGVTRSFCATRQQRLSSYACAGMVHDQSHLVVLHEALFVSARQNAAGLRAQLRLAAAEVRIGAFSG